MGKTDVRINMDFETKLAAAGDVLEKLASERGLNVADFTEQEVSDLLSTIMGEDGDKTAAEAPITPAAAAPPAKTAAEAPAAPQLTYGQVMAEVVKVASANGYDITKASPAELDDAVQKMATLLSTPGYLEKQAALQEKVAEADAMGRIMAHAYVDELGKFAAKAKVAEDKKDEKEKDEKEEKKASLVRALRGKTAGEMPEAFKKHLKGKDDDKDKDEHEKGESKEKEEAEEKKAAFAKQASLLATERLIVAGINPATGAKFASEQEALTAASDLILAQKGYL